MAQSTERNPRITEYEGRVENMLNALDQELPTLRVVSSPAQYGRLVSLVSGAVGLLKEGKEKFELKPAFVALHESLLELDRLVTTPKREFSEYPAVIDRVLGCLEAFVVNPPAEGA